MLWVWAVRKRGGEGVQRGQEVERKGRGRGRLLHFQASQIPRFQTSPGPTRGVWGLKLIAFILDVTKSNPLQNYNTPGKRQICRFFIPDNIDWRFPFRFYKLLTTNQLQNINCSVFSGGEQTQHWSWTFLCQHFFLRFNWHKHRQWYICVELRLVYEVLHADVSVECLCWLFCHQ